MLMKMPDAADAEFPFNTRIFLPICLSLSEFAVARVPLCLARLGVETKINKKIVRAVYSACAY